MRTWLEMRLLAATAGILAMAPLAVADATVPYGRAVLETPSLETRRTTPLHDKISDDLYTVVRHLEGLGTARARRQAQVLAHEGQAKPAFVLKGQEASLLQVYVSVTEKSERNLGRLERYGMEIETTSPTRPIVQGFLPLHQIEDLAAEDFVTGITRPFYAIPTAGPTINQADARMGTNLLRLSQLTDPLNPNPGVVDGTGTQIGVISNGLFTDPSGPFGGQIPVSNCNFLQTTPNSEEPERTATDLPVAPFEDCNDVPGIGYFGGIPIFPATLSRHVVNTAEENFAVSSNGIPEGAAILEAIHDIAPGASKRYATARTDIDVERAREWMVPQFRDPNAGVRNPRDMDVIVDNLVFTGLGRYDGTSAMSRDAYEMSRLNNIVYVVSGGGVTPPSDGLQTTVQRFPMQVTGFFNPDFRNSRAKVHSWSGGGGATRDEALSVETFSLAGGASGIELTLVWDDYWDDLNPRATTDLDLYLVPRSTLSLSDAVAASVRLQNGFSSNPVERLVYFPTTVEPLAVVIVNKDITSNARPLFTLTIEQGRVSESQYLTHGVALNNADAWAPVISVGAVDLRTLSTAVEPSTIPGLRPYGTINNEFIKWYTDQVYPSVVGFSGIDTGTHRRLFPRADQRQAFRGPSAAAANIGGVVSLMRHTIRDSDGRQIPPRRMYELMRDTSGLRTGGDPDNLNDRISPLAVDITPDETAAFRNAPSYIRPNPLSMYDAITGGQIRVTSEDAESRLPLSHRDTNGSWLTDWTPNRTDPHEDADLPEYRVSDMGLEIKAVSDHCYGYWQSPILQLQGEGDEEPRSWLRTDKLYMAEVRVGTTSTDPLTTPMFRLRLMTDYGDEVSNQWISNIAPGTNNAPDSLAGKTYRVYFQPTNDRVAEQGVRFYFDILGFNEQDDFDQWLILRDFRFVEMDLPSSTN